MTMGPYRDAELRDWLHEPVTLGPLDGARLERGLDDTPQRRGWLPRLETGRSRMFAAITSIAAVATLAVAGGVLLTTQESADPSGVGAPAAAAPSAMASESVSPQPTLRDSVPWGSKRIYYVPPPDFPYAAEFGVHDVARVAPAACADGDSLVEVGPTAEDLTDALADLKGQESSGPVDVMVSGYPAKQFVIPTPQETGTPGCRVGPEGSVALWENHDGTHLGMLDGGFAIILVGDVDGERLAFAAFTPGHGPYGSPGFPGSDLAQLEALADALVASMEIADPDPLRTAWVTGTARGGTLAGSPEVIAMDGLTRSRYHWTDQTITMSDPRLSGTFEVTYNQDVYDAAAGDLSQFNVGAGTYRIENEAGAWEGPNIFLNEGASGTATVSDTGVLVGSGAYEGLSAFLVFDFTQRPAAVVGAVFPGEMPPVATFD